VTRKRPEGARSEPQASEGIWRRGLARFAAGAFHAAHEDFEDLWRAYGRRSREGRLLQALVQLCASELKRESGGRAAGRLAARAAAHLEGLPDPLLGIRTAELAIRIRAPERPIAIPLAPVDAVGCLR
jgi:predicted metal-dependent hydrolase